MLFCCFSFQGFSLSTFSTKTVTRSGARVRRGRSSLFLSWGCSIFGLDRIPSFAQNGLFSPTREKYSSLLPSRKKFGSRRKRGGRKRGEREGESEDIFYLPWFCNGSKVVNRHRVCILGASELHPLWQKITLNSKFHHFCRKRVTFCEAEPFRIQKQKVLVCRKSRRLPKCRIAIWLRIQLLMMQLDVEQAQTMTQKNVKI